MGGDALSLENSLVIRNVACLVRALGCTLIHLLISVLYQPFVYLLSFYLFNS